MKNGVFSVFVAAKVVYFCKASFCCVASSGSTYRFLQIYKHEATRRLVTIAVNAIMAGTFIAICSLRVNDKKLPFQCLKAHLS